MKILHPLSFILSVFFFVSPVFAQTYNFQITSSMIDFVSDPAYLTAVNTASDTWLPYSYYILNNSTQQWYFGVKQLNPANSPFSITCYHRSGNNRYINCSPSPSPSNQIGKIINSDYSLTYEASASSFLLSMDGTGANTNYYMLSYFGDIVPTFNYLDREDTINITDGTNTFSCTVNSTNTSCVLPTIYSWYLDYYYVPPDSDDYPLLTSFITLVIDKLSYVCEFITSSYIYLSIFVIFILYFIILLFRRLS